MFVLANVVSAMSYQTKPGSEEEYKGVFFSTVKNVDKSYSYNDGKASIMLVLDGPKTEKGTDDLWDHAHEYAQDHNLRIDEGNVLLRPFTVRNYKEQIHGGGQATRIVISTTTDFDPDPNHYK